MSGYNSFMAGGRLNSIGGWANNIIAGVSNTIFFTDSGYDNSPSYSSISGGYRNTISGYGSHNSISGGYGNTASFAYCGFIGSGTENILGGYNNNISGGRNNNISSTSAYSSISGGCCNTISGDLSLIHI